MCTMEHEYNGSGDRCTTDPPQQQHDIVKAVRSYGVCQRFQPFRINDLEVDQTGIDADLPELGPGPRLSEAKDMDQTGIEPVTS